MRVEFKHNHGSTWFVHLRKHPLTGKRGVRVAICDPSTGGWSVVESGVDLRPSHLKEIERAIDAFDGGGDSSG